MKNRTTWNGPLCWERVTFLALFEIKEWLLSKINQIKQTQYFRQFSFVDSMLLFNNIILFDF